MHKTFLLGRSKVTYKMWNNYKMTSSHRIFTNWKSTTWKKETLYDGEEKKTSFRLQLHTCGHTRVIRLFLSHSHREAGTNFLWKISKPRNRCLESPTFSLAMHSCMGWVVGFDWKMLLFSFLLILPSFKRQR